MRTLTTSNDVIIFAADECKYESTVISFKLFFLIFDTKLVPNMVESKFCEMIFLFKDPSYPSLLQKYKNSSFIIAKTT